MEKKYITSRLVLKTLGASNNEAKLVADYFIRNKEHLQPWDPYRSVEFYKVENRKAALEWEEEEVDKGTYYRFWIFNKDDVKCEKIIGTIGISNIKRGVMQSCAIGYSIDKEEAGVGYITESMTKVLDIIFNEYKLHRIEATVMPSNKASLRVLEKLNFKHEGVCEKYQKINGNWEDHILLALLNEDFQE